MSIGNTTRQNVNKGFFLLPILIFFSPLSAQDYKRDYKSAKEFYGEKQYNFAMEGFKPMMVYDKANPYTEYASFYYALSAYHQNYFSVAKESLLQLKKLYPEWEQADEVNYWLAAVYFQQGEIFQALRMLNSMKSPRDLISIERMKNNFLYQLDDEAVVRLILEEFPGEVPVLKRLINRKISNGEYKGARELIAANGLSENEFVFPEQKMTIKDKYRVAALFPFLSFDLDPSPGAKRNQSTLDLYQGMKLATDSLISLGTMIDLVGYDTEREVGKVAALMALEEIKSADVLVGPLFADEMAPVQSYCKANQVPMVNPISNNPTYLFNNPNSLLVQPDFETIGRASAEALAKRKIKKPCVVFFGDNRKDSVMAAAFLKRAEELNIRIAIVQGIAKGNSTEVYSTLVTPTKFDKFRNPIEFELKKDSIGSVFVASDDELIFTKVISSIDRRADSVIIVGQDTWIDKPSMDLDKFERLHIMMSSPSYTDIFSFEYKQFQKPYASRFGVLPTSFAKIGFECMMFIGKALSQYGTEFISELQKSPEIIGSFQRTYRFQDAQCNKDVPFVHFENGELRLLKD